MYCKSLSNLSYKKLQVNAKLLLSLAKTIYYIYIIIIYVFCLVTTKGRVLNLKHEKSRGRMHEVPIACLQLTAQ